MVVFFTAVRGRRWPSTFVRCRVVRAIAHGRRPDHLQHGRARRKPADRGPPAGPDRSIPLQERRLVLNLNRITSGRVPKEGPMTTGIASTSVATTSSGNFTVSTVNSVFVLNAKAYGAKGDGQVVSDGAMTSGSATLTSATANFSSADVGKLVLVKDALTGPNTLSGTITGFTSATQVTLSVSATRTVSNATVFWGTDDKSAVNTAISDAAALNPGGAMIQFDAGRFCFSDSIDLSNRIGIGLQGSGNMTGGGPPGTQLLLFDNTTKNLVKATTSSGVVIKNMQLLAFATQYSGTLVLANSGTPQVCHILNASLDARGSTATLLDLSTGNGIVVERVLFSYGGTQVIGSNTANNIVIRS